MAIVQLAIEGKVEEAMAQYKKGGDVLSASSFILALCLFGAIINLFLIPGPWNGYAVLANSIVGLAITLPMIITGQVRRSRARRLLSLEDQAHRSIKAESHPTAALLPPAIVTDPLLSRAPVPGSVTEQTTLNLESPERHH